MDRSQLHSLLANTTGQHVLTNVSFNNGPPETIRLNATSGDCSFWRCTGKRDTFSVGEPPFQFHYPSLCFSFGQLGQWQKNFAVVHDAIGDFSLGSIPAVDARNKQILCGLQNRTFEIDHIDKLLHELDFDTALYQSYSLKENSLNLSDGGLELLESFANAVSNYGQIPELRSFSKDRENRRRGDLGPHGQRFREWFSQNSLTLNDNGIIEYIDDELKPLHLSGREFRWNQNEGDLRLVSVDLLCEYGGHPVWCEVKMDGDSWTSSAVLQILFYGSMICSGNQQRRIRRRFYDRFEQTRPMLGVIVEKRDNQDFQSDFESSLQFARHQKTQSALGPYFDGMIFIVIQSDADGWAVKRSEVVPW